MTVQEQMAALIEIAERTGAAHEAFRSDDAIYVVVHGNEILGAHQVPGVRIEATETDDGIDAEITVERGVVLPKPVNLCFGHLGKEGRQVIQSHIVIEDGAKAVFMAHCIFPNATLFLHAMEGTIEIGSGASFAYREVHVHSREGRIEVRPVSKVRVGPGSLYEGDFTLVEGRVGDLNLDFDVEAWGAKSRVEVTSKVYGKYDDTCKVRDVVRLTGEGSSALVKARVVLSDASRGLFLGMIDGAASGARGHLDCTEIVQGRAQAEASPVVKASHPEAEVTHEAAIGRIADDKIAGLMAKGLSEDESVDVIVSGLLR